ncbi:MAG: hypothetical protein R3248_14175 [Candidatus Promineifilaceae bacterium]|nr:hypothetical protein [Candidatus Promineifilaceae bacterium]
MFEVNQTYANRKGKYTVLEVNPPKMRVRYEDGTEAELNVEIQTRIWENIQSEEEARAVARTARRRRRGPEVSYYVKTLSLEDEDDISVPGWRERITVVSADGPELKPGDRILYYAVEDRVFFALGTVTGGAQSDVPTGFFYSEEEARTLRFYPTDLDEQTYDVKNGIHLDSAELESLPNYRTLLRDADRYLQISEDDFELLAEWLTELTEVEDEEFEDEEEEDDYDE